MHKLKTSSIHSMTPIASTYGLYQKIYIYPLTMELERISQLQIQISMKPKYPKQWNPLSFV